MSDDRTAELTVDVRAATPLAVLVDNGATEAWLPIGQVTLLDGALEAGETAEIEVPEWLARREGLI